MKNSLIQFDENKLKVEPGKPIHPYFQVPTMIHVNGWNHYLSLIHVECYARFLAKFDRFEVTTQDQYDLAMQMWKVRLN